jgi:hypothetical protein
MLGEGTEGAAATGVAAAVGVLRRRRSVRMMRANKPGLSERYAKIFERPRAVVLRPDRDHLHHKNKDHEPGRQDAGEDARLHRHVLPSEINGPENHCFILSNPLRMSFMVSHPVQALCRDLIRIG